MTKTLKVDDLVFEVRRSDRRRTMEITVDRGGELVLAAPTTCPTSRLERFIRDKKFWIYKKLASKETSGPAAPPKEYVTGEGFYYLGRTHRLQLVAAQGRPLLLEHGRFRLVRAEAVRGREHFVRWYVEHARPWITRRVEPYAGRIGVRPAGVTVRDLGHRWASCGKAGRLNFHWAAILLPPAIVEYLVVHELVHLREPHHTAAFWRRVERVLPDAEARRRRLTETGATLLGW